MLRNILSNTFNLFCSRTIVINPTELTNDTSFLRKQSNVEGTHGHIRNRFTCDNIKTRRLIDKRYKRCNRKASTCIRDRKTGERVGYRTRRTLRGIIEPALRTCTKCNIDKPQNMFIDLRVSKKDRATIRNTIICSDCNPRHNDRT